MLWYAGMSLRVFAHALCFAGNAFGPESARAISSALERNSTLTRLDMGCESTAFAHAASIGCMALFLHSPACISTYSPVLSVDKTMGIDGARAIGVMLQRNGTLLNLSLTCKQPPLACASSSLYLEFYASMPKF